VSIVITGLPMFRNCSLTVAGLIASPQRVVGQGRRRGDLGLDTFARRIIPRIANRGSSEIDR
jgi:hypothetical protein